MTRNTRLVGPKRKEVTGDRRKLHKNQLAECYSGDQKVAKEWVEKRDIHQTEYRILMRNREGKMDGWMDGRKDRRTD